MCRSLGVVTHMKKIPEKFALHMRYKFVTDAIVPARPSFQIGHHMMVISYLKGGGVDAHSCLASAQREAAARW